MALREHRPPVGAIAERLADRGPYRKAWDFADGTRHLRVSHDPIHYQDGTGAWQECDPTWVNWRVLTLPYRLELLAAPIVGVRYTDRQGRVSTARLTAVDGVPLPGGLVPTVSGDTVTWQILPTLRVTISARSWGVQILKWLLDATAPRSFTWLMTTPSAEPVAIVPPVGVDNVNLVSVSQGRDQRRLDVTAAVTLVAADGTTRTFRITDSWNGLALPTGDFNRPIIYPVMIDPTFSQTISAGAQDGYYSPYAGGNWAGTATKAIVGQYDANTANNGGFRFTSVTIPQGAVVSSATLTLNARSFKSGYTPVGSNTYGDDLDDAPVWTNASCPRNDGTGFTKTTAVTAYSWASTGVKVLTITGIIQELLDRPGWVSGNIMRLGVFENETVAGRAVYLDVVETVSGSPAVLDVTYTTGAAPQRTLLGVGV